LKKAALNDPTFLIAAETDERFFNVVQEKEKLKRDLRDNQRQIVEQLRKQLTVLRQNFDSAKDKAEEVGITDLSQFIKGIDSLDAGIDEIDKLYTNNSYFDLLKAEQVARNIFNEGLKVYERNIEEWIKIKNAAISELKSEKGKVKGGWLPWLAGLAIWLIFFPFIWFNQPPRFTFAVWIGAGFWLVFIPSVVLFNLIVKKFKRLSMDN